MRSVPHCQDARHKRECCLIELPAAPTAATACHCLQLDRHIFVADKGNYYGMADGLPQNPR